MEKLRITPFAQLLLLSCCFSLSTGRFFLGGGPGVVQDVPEAVVYDHLRDLELENRARDFRLSRVQVWSDGTEGTILGFQASYVVQDVVLTSHVQRVSNHSLANAASLTIDLTEREFIESLSGHYTVVAGNVSVHHLRFSVKNGTNSSATDYSTGRIIAGSFSETVLGPVVAFRSIVLASAFSHIGIYVDPTEWVARETRVLKLPLHGASNIASGSTKRDPLGSLTNPIVLIQATHDNNTIYSMNWLSSVGVGLFISSGRRANSTSTSSVVLNTTRPMDYVTSVRIDFSSNCVSGIQLDVYRGNMDTTEVFTFGQVTGEGSISLAENVTISGFFGMSSSSCINALGVHTTVPVLCPLLDPPENGIILDNPPLAVVGSSYQFGCNSGCTLTGSQTRYCTENQSWNGDPTQCQCATITVPFLIGLAFGCLGFLLVVIAIALLSLYFVFSKN